MVTLYKYCRHRVQDHGRRMGGIITEIDVPDRNGKSADIVLGYESLQRYLERSPYFGALVETRGYNRTGQRPVYAGWTHIYPCDEQWAEPSARRASRVR